LKQAAAYLVKGLSACVHGPSALRNEIANSPDFWSVLRRLRGSPEAAETVLNISEHLINSTPSGITADNYEALIILLNDFATAASVGAVQEQQRDQAALRGKAVKAKPQYVGSRVIFQSFETDND
jgi:golgi-specific brefeldin A-resistance guanine nucleotide exchange factor 1